MRPSRSWEPSGPLEIRDATQNWYYSTDVSFASAQKASAEWVVERPEVSNDGVNFSLSSLADFGSTSFTNAMAISGSGAGTLATLGAASIEMVNGSGAALDQTSAWDSTAESFGDSWLASS